MKKQVSLLIMSIALLAMLSSTRIQSAAELPDINVAACNKLWKAAEVGNLEAVQQALVEGAEINVRAQYGDKRAHHHKLPVSTPLAVAAREGKLDVVRFLLKQGAMVDAIITGSTPLIVAFSGKNLFRPTVKRIVTELLTHKAQVNAQTHHSKETPLVHAIRYLEDESIARQLILAGADITIKTAYKQTAFDMIKTDAMREAFLEACAINEQAFQELEALEAILRTEVLQNPHVPVTDLAQLITDYAIPFYTNQGESQPAYNLLNTRIAEQWKLIKEKPEKERLLNQ